jgi:hypothetical protein
VYLVGWLRALGVATGWWCSRDDEWKRLWLLAVSWIDVRQSVAYEGSLMSTKRDINFSIY